MRLTVLSLLLLPTVPAAAQNTRLNLDLRATPLRDAVARVLEGTGEQFVVAPDVRDVPITLKLQDLRPDAALRAVVRQAATSVGHLQAVREGDVWLIQPRAAEIGNQLPSAAQRIPDFAHQLVSPALTGALGDVLPQLFRGSGLTVAVEPHAENAPVTLHLRSVPLITALRLAVRQAGSRHFGLTYSVDGTRFVLHMASRPDEDPHQKPVTLELRDVPLRAALQALFRGTGLQYSIDPDVPDVPVTLVVRDMPFSKALRVLIRQARVSVPGLTYTRG
jgi:type II secretory pathway component GspD/PulD (secretin)